MPARANGDNPCMLMHTRSEMPLPPPASRANGLVRESRLRAHKAKQLIMGMLLMLALLVAVVFPARELMAQPDVADPVIDLRAFPEMVSLSGRSTYWVDTTGQLTVDEMDASFERRTMQRHLSTTMTALSGNAALWIRFSVQHHVGDGPWELEIPWAGIDHIDFFHRDADGNWQSETAGDRYAVSSWPIPERYPAFSLPTRGEKLDHYWLRIEHRNMPFSGDMVLHHQYHLRHLRTIEEVLLGGFFGMALVLTAVAVVNAVMFKDRAFGAFAAYSLALAVQQAAATGFGGLLLWPDAPYWNGIAEFVLLPVFCVAGIYFVRTLFIGVMPRWVDRYSIVLGPLFLVVTAWHAVYWSQLSANVLYLFGAATVALLVTSIWYGWRVQEGWNRWVLLGMAPMGLAGTLIIFRSLGLIPNTFWPQYAMVIGAAIQGPMLLVGLLQRSSAQNEAQARARALTTNEPLTGLTNRHNFAVRLHDTLSRSTRYGYRCALLLVELDNHTWFEAEYGREVSDRALVLTASLLRSVARDVDAAARIDDATMALLMEGPVRPPQVMAAATSLVARALRPTEELPAGTSLRLKIVMAMLPDNGVGSPLDAQKHLVWLQEALVSLRTEDTRTIAALNF